MRTGFVPFLALLAASPAAADTGWPWENGYPIENRLLDAHNAERVRLHEVPFEWSGKLADDARAWALKLAKRGVLEHDPSNRHYGENLWTGSTGAFAPEEIVRQFIDERNRFIPGRFPQVSRTGNWADVGHFTQIIWPGSRKVGCALVRGGSHDWLVCRYDPPGNVMGERVP